MGRTAPISRRIPSQVAVERRSRATTTRPAPRDPSADGDPSSADAATRPDERPLGWTETLAWQGTKQEHRRPSAARRAAMRTLWGVVFAAAAAGLILWGWRAGFGVALLAFAVGAARDHAQHAELTVGEPVTVTWTPPARPSKTIVPGVSYDVDADGHAVTFTRPATAEDVAAARAIDECVGVARLLPPFLAAGGALYLLGATGVLSTATADRLEFAGGGLFLWAFAIYLIRHPNAMGFTQKLVAEGHRVDAQNPGLLTTLARVLTRPLGATMARHLRIRRWPGVPVMLIGAGAAVIAGALLWRVQQWVTAIWDAGVATVQLVVYLGVFVLVARSLVRRMHSGTRRSRSLAALLAVATAAVGYGLYRLGVFDAWVDIGRWVADHVS